MYQRNKKYLMSWGGSISKLTLLMWFLFIGPVSVGANFRITVIPGVTLEEKNRWIEVTFEHEYPSTSSWLAEGSEWQANNGEQFSYMP